MTRSLSTLPCLPKRAIIVLSMILFWTAGGAIGDDWQGDPLLSHDQVAELSDDPQWLRLLHVENSVSEVVSASFFLSEDGRHSPADELIATVEALAQPFPESTPEQHAACQFPARLQWLTDRGAINTNLSPINDCPEFRAWTGDGNLTSAGVVFASGYLGNPASYYGHLLLKFNHSANEDVADLLATSVNFGARVPDQENPLAYVFKGLFGGYQARFSRAYYFENRNLYGDEQLRDLWDYQLNLSEQEVYLLAAHVWELLDEEFDYYFALENCAYRVARVLEVVTEAPLINSRSPWAVPITVFQNLAELERGGESMVRDIRHFPSRQKRFHERYANLSSDQQSAVRNLVDNHFDLSSDRYQALSTADRAQIVMTLLDYLEYQALADQPMADQPVLGEYRRRLLLERLSLGRQAPMAPDVTEPAPHLGNRPSVLGTGVLSTSTSQQLTLRARATSHDMISLPAGRVPYSSLTMLDLELTIDEDALGLNYFEALKIETLGVSPTGLPGDRSAGWRLRAALDREVPGCRQCLVGKLEAGLGQGAALDNLGAAYAFTDLHLQTPGSVYDPLGASIATGLVTRPGTYWGARLEAGWRASIPDIDRGEPFVWVQQRLGSSPRWDVRMNYHYQTEHQAQVQINYYW